jgi:integrase/recombinase XerC
VDVPRCDNEDNRDRALAGEHRRADAPVGAESWRRKLAPKAGAESWRRPRRCGGVRDEALVRLYYNTGARLSEIGNLLLTDVDMNTQSVALHRKGAKDRRVRFGTKAARGLSVYLRARAKKRYADEIPQLWMAERGKVALTPNGIKLMLKRRGQRAGLGHVHAHRWWHNYAHEWKLAGGNTGDLMLLGWSSEGMPRHYGKSAAAERAQELQTQMGIGEKV